MKLGSFRSLSNPETRYAIHRHGRTQALGGEGVEWECSCPAFQKDGKCKHLRCVFAYAKDRNNLYDLVESGFFNITAKGRKYFKLYDFDPRAEFYND